MLFNANDVLIDNNFIFIIKNNIFIILAGVLISTPVYNWVTNKLKFNNKKIDCVFNIVFVILYLMGVMLSVAYLVSSSYNPFLYFRF